MTSNDGNGRSVTTIADVVGFDDATPSRDGLETLTSLSGVQRDIVVVITDLRGTQPSGSTVRTRLDEYRTDDISHGAFYRNLRELHERGVVARSPVDGRTYSYRLTDRGRSSLASYVLWAASSLRGDAPSDSDGADTDAPWDRAN